MINLNNDCPMHLPLMKSSVKYKLLLIVIVTVSHNISYNVENCIETCKTKHWLALGAYGPIVSQYIVTFPQRLFGACLSNIIFQHETEGTHTAQSGHTPGAYGKNEPQNVPSVCVLTAQKN